MSFNINAKNKLFPRTYFFARLQTKSTVLFWGGGININIKKSEIYILYRKFCTEHVRNFLDDDIIVTSSVYRTQFTCILFSPAVIYHIITHN